MPSDVLDAHHTNFEPSCFYTGFNGPFDFGFAGVSFADSSDPLTLSQATRRPHWSKWEEAIHSELKALDAFDTFDVVTLPPGKNQ